MKNEAQELASSFCPFGYLDLQAACAIWDAIELRESDLFEIIDNERESFGLEGFDKLDPVAAVLEHILQMARNRIDEVTGYDFLNDFSWSGEIYTYSNFMCSSYDYSEEAVAELKRIVLPHLTNLKKDRFCDYLLSELEIGAD